METLDLTNAILVGHSTGGGVIARYIGRYGTARVAKTAFIGATVPVVMQTPGHPGGVPTEFFDDMRPAVLAGFPASYLGIAAFAETDVTNHMNKIDVPTLILHGDDDQIAPWATPPWPPPSYPTPSSRSIPEPRTP
jgi:non-heme chloroperoxidase